MLAYTAIPVGILESNCYLLNDGGALALVDCGVFSRRVREAVAAQGGDLRLILLTHGHFDHIQGVASAREAYPGAQVCIGAEDKGYLSGEEPAIPGRAMARGNPVTPDRLLKDGDTLTLGESTLRVVATPGHTRGGVCFYREPNEEEAKRGSPTAGGLLFTGDTLFYEEVGRADFPGGDWPTLKASVLRLYELPGDCKVLPGHGPESSLAHERAHNPHVKG